MKYVQLPNQDENQIFKNLSKCNCTTTYEFQDFISSYKEIGKFTALHRLQNEVWQNKPAIFQYKIKKIILLASRLPELIQNDIPILEQKVNHSITLSQLQIACLLANAFLCTFAIANINFDTLFSAESTTAHQKLLCIFNYFEKVTETEPKGFVTITRHHLNDSEFPEWDSCANEFNEELLKVSVNGTIEDNGLGLLQVNFANKNIGGDVLGNGYGVQEEILFAICPELIVTKLFTQEMTSNESICIIGCERYSNYIGYASRFQYNGPHDDISLFDSDKRRKRYIIAIDALKYQNYNEQFNVNSMERELKKAYVGYTTENAPFIATGNWGCGGSCKGEKKLKSLLQIMVCCVADKSIIYFTYKNLIFSNELQDFYKFLYENKITVSQLWKYLKKYGDNKDYTIDIYNYIKDNHMKATNLTLVRSVSAVSQYSIILPAITINRQMSTSSTIESMHLDLPKQNTLAVHADSNIRYNKNRRKSSHVAPTIQRMRRNSSTHDIHQVQEPKPDEPSIDNLNNKQEDSKSCCNGCTIL